MPNILKFNSRLYNKNFILLTASSFLFFFNMHAFVLLPVWIKELGGSESDIGYIMGATSFSTIFSTPFVGYLVDKHDKKKLLFMGTTLLALTSLPLVLISNLVSLIYALRIMQGFAFSLFFVSAGTLVTEVSPKENRTEALGIFGVFTIINYAFAPFIGRKIVEYFDFNYFFILISIVGLLALPFILNIKIVRTSDNEKLSEEDVSLTKILKRPAILLSAFTLLIAGSGFIPTLSFLPVFSQKLKIMEFEIFFISYTFAVLFIRLVVGWIPDRIGKIKTVIPSLVIFTASIIYLGFSEQKVDLILCGLLFGFGHGFLYPTLYSIVIDNSRLSERGKVFSICSVAFTLGGMLGAFSYGIVAENYGYAYMYKLIGSICLLGFLVFILYYIKELFKFSHVK